MGFNNLPCQLQKAFHSQSLLKIISGLNNFDKYSVERISRAGRAGGADLLDVACDPELVKLAASESDLPICVSAVEPKKFIPAISAGAIMAEIGNFDSFYQQGRFFDASEVLQLTIETRLLLPDVFLSVTVPHTIPLDKQSQLALDLVTAGADCIQTEGGKIASPSSAGVLGLIEKAAPTLSATYAISKALKMSNCQIPVLSASGLTSVTIPMAIASGASGVGVGSAVSLLKEELAMVASIRSMKEACSAKKTLNTMA